jgi:3-hydroxy-9,10-secoandrosta-1,3,5(10)-triene-9,17-dione monooxygenase reductase component
LTAGEPPTEDVFRPDAAEFRRVLGQFATGVTVITAMDGEEPAGVVANSFTSVSLDPPLVLFCVARTSSTWPRIERARCFAVNILGEHQEETSRLFATRDVDRFASVEWHVGVGGSPVLEDCLAYLDCEFWAEYDGGDHIIVVGRVLDLGVPREAGPLLFFQGKYGRLVTLQAAPGATDVAGRGAAVVVIGTDPGAVGARIAKLEDHGVRATAFVGDPGTERDALVEMLAELHATRHETETNAPS